MSQANYIGAQIRSHAFSFDITPRNQHEQEQAAMIIEKLEDGQLGAKKRDMGGLLLDFPSSIVNIIEVMRGLVLRQQVDEVYYCCLLLEMSNC